MENEKFSHNKGKKMCDLCRHFYPRGEMLKSKRGLYCPECYVKIHGIRRCRKKS